MDNTKVIVLDNAVNHANTVRITVAGVAYELEASDLFIASHMLTKAVNEAEDLAITLVDKDTGLELVYKRQPLETERSLTVGDITVTTKNEVLEIATLLKLAPEVISY